MKISDIKRYCIADTTGRKYFIVKVETDDGVYGLGEVGTDLVGALHAALGDGDDTENDRRGGKAFQQREVVSAVGVLQ